MRITIALIALLATGLALHEFGPPLAEKIGGIDAAIAIIGLIARFTE